ncbi:MAG: hypothetical protein KGZ57_07145 [Dethiobacter sp.]|nr:hypothetical protein [Dethiobacter sp.]MCL5982129.1 hypothetical protein [Bacillota bacterium]
MQKKNLIIIALLLILAGALVYPLLTGGGQGEAAAGVKDVTANPSGFLGPLVINGHVGDVNAADGVIMLVDDGCVSCQIPVLVPFTTEQQAKFEVDTLYSGILPAVGETVTVHGTLKQQEGYFIFDVEKITRDGQVIISKAKS